MAGDWIKIEQTTPDKPEVIAMAWKLKIDPDAVVGKLLRIWIWADQNSVSGNGITVTDSFLDRLTHCKGFAVAMRVCGWLAGDEGALSFPGFDRHNGRTAKERAEMNRRVAKHRSGNGNVTEKTLQKPLPEKRREEKILPKEVEEAAAAACNPSELARQLCLAHPARAQTRPALEAARRVLTRHDFGAVLAGTVAYAAAVEAWTSAERLQFVKNPEAFFEEDIWNQPAANWQSRTAAKRPVNRQKIDVGGRHPSGIMTSHLD